MSLPPNHKLLGAAMLLGCGFGVLFLDVVYHHSATLEWAALGLFAGGGGLLGAQVFRQNQPPPKS